MASSSSALAAVASDRGEGAAEERALTGLLSDDTLLHVMRRLPTRQLLSSSAPVCRRWRRLCRSFGVYELVPCPLSSSMKPWGNMSQKKLLKMAVVYASTLEKINLIGLKKLGSKDVIALCSRLPKLRDLAIVSCPLLTAADYKLIVSQLPTQLLTFDIHLDFTIACHCRGIPSYSAEAYFINDGILERLYQQCPHLQKLDLDFRSFITPTCLDGLLLACQSLTSLDLDSDGLGWPEIAKVFTSCKSLCHFSLVSSILMSDSSDESESMERFSRGHSRLRAQKNKERVFIGSEALSGVLMPKHLTSIRLYSSRHQSVGLEHSPMLEMLRSNGHQLQELHAQGVFNTSWQTISVYCGQLKTLDLSHISQDALILTGVEEVVLCGLIHLLKKLERIALPSATDRILTELGQFCPNLRELRFQDFVSKSRYTRYNAVTDRGIVAVAEGCPGLRVLSLSGCHNVTISSARALAFHCRQLEVLILNGCAKFNDDAISALLPRLSKSLLFLDLVGCSITQSFLRTFQHYAKVTTLRVVAISKSLWMGSQSVIVGIHISNARLRIRSESGIVWNGFYHGKSFN